jgi:hypothetical protein
MLEDDLRMGDKRARALPSWKWISEWNAERPIKFPSKFLKATEGTWLPSPHWPGKARDLAVTLVSNDFAARHICLSTTPDTQNHGGLSWYHDADLFFFLVLKGRLSILSLSRSLTFDSGDVGYIPPLTPWTVTSYSPDCELLEVTAPNATPIRGGASANKLLLDRRGLESPIPPFRLTRAEQLGPEKDDDGGMGLRKFWRYRNLGTAAVTEGRMEAIVIETLDAPPPEAATGTGWHNHNMCEFYFCLRGWEENRLKDVGVLRTELHDSGTIGAGHSHNTARFSSDYVVVQVAVPAKYETFAVTPPPEFSE